jgi:hypothetical protein
MYKAKKKKFKKIYGTLSNHCAVQITAVKLSFLGAAVEIVINVDYFDLI